MLPRRMLVRFVFIALANGALLNAAYGSDDLPRPEGPVLLDVTGKITVSNDGTAARFDRQMLNALPQHRLETYTDWTEGLQVFEGPLLADLLERVGAYGETLSAAALNDYAVDIPRRDAKDYPVILALRHNGVPMSIRNKGPIWIIYPNPNREAATASPHNKKSVWQLNSLNVR